MGRLHAVAMSVAIASTCAAAARAEDEATAPAVPAVRGRMTWHGGVNGEGRDGEDEVATTARVFTEQRAFVHLLDPSTPGAGQVGVEYGVGAASRGPAERDLPMTVIPNGAAHTIGLGVGATDRVAPFVVAHVFQPLQQDQGSAELAAELGVRWQITRPDAKLRLALSGAAVRDYGGNAGGYVLVAATYDVDRLRIGANGHFERIFAEGRDPVDVIAMAGVSYKTTDALRVGAEWVGQDLEGLVDPDEAEGGARHYAGPTAALDLGSGRAQIVGGPAFGLSARTPTLLGRVAMLVSF